MRLDTERIMFNSRDFEDVITRHLQHTVPEQQWNNLYRQYPVSGTIFGRVSPVIGWEWADRSHDVTQIPTYLPRSRSNRPR